MTGRPALFDADDTRGKYFSGATWTEQVPNSGIRDGATRYIGPRGARHTGARSALMAAVVQQEMDTLIADLMAQAVEEQVVLDYLNEQDEADYELLMRRALLPGWLFSSADMNSSLTDWCYEYRINDTYIRLKSIDDKCNRRIPSLEAAVKTWREDAPTLTPDSFYELETAVISLHPSD